MNIQKKPVRGSILKKEKKIQITMDRDMNVPDYCPDLEKIADSRGNIQIQETELMNDKIRIKGTLSLEILYISSGMARKVYRMEHEYMVDEVINVEGVKPEDNVWVQAELEDLSVHMINSRKCGFRTVITFYISVSQMQIMQCSTKVADGEKVECLYDAFTMTELVMDKKDIQRIKTTVELPTGKSNIRNILWMSLQLNDVETKMLEDRISVKGNVCAFLLYEGEDDLMQYYNWEIPFAQELACSDSRENLIGDISVQLGSYQMMEKTDVDGENRQVEIDAVLNLHVKAYQERQLTYLKDLYANDRQLNWLAKSVMMENLIFQNKARNKITYRVRDKNLNQLLQILLVEGSVHIEDYQKRKNGVLTQGIVFAKMLYIVSDDNAPIQSKDFVIPFEYLVEAPNVDTLERCEIKSVLEQISGSVIEGNEVEIRVTAGIYLTGYQKEKISMIDTVEEIPFTEEEMKGIPSITGYIVKQEDTLWDIAKQFRTTMHQVKKSNELTGDKLEQGQKLIIVKQQPVF